MPSASIDVTLVDPLVNPQWDRWVQTHPGCTFFHTSAWAKVLVKTYGHKPFYLRFSQRERTVALIPLMQVRSLITGCRAVSVPFSDSCAPLIFSMDAAAAILDRLCALAHLNHWRHLELRGPLLQETSAIRSNEFLGHTLEITSDAQTLFSHFSSATRGAIRKAQKSGVTAHIKTSKDAVVEFYRLHSWTRKRHGVPPQPFSFFRNIYEEIIQRGLGFVVSASRGSDVVAAAIYFRLGKKAIYKFGASDERQRDVRGNNLVMWEAIQFFAETGAETLDFGRTSPDNDGLRRFKRSWGTSELNLAYYRFNPKSRTWMTGSGPSSGFHNTLFSRLPSVLNRIAGEIIYPHLD